MTDDGSVPLPSSVKWGSQHLSCGDVLRMKWDRRYLALRMAAISSFSTVISLPCPKHGHPCLRPPNARKRVWRQKEGSWDGSKLCLELTVIESHNGFFWETMQIKRKRMKQEAVVTSFQYLSLSGKRVELMNRWFLKPFMRQIQCQTGVCPIPEDFLRH